MVSKSLCFFLKQQGEKGRPKKKHTLNGIVFIKGSDHFFLPYSTKRFVQLSPTKKMKYSSLFGNTVIQAR